MICGRIVVKNLLNSVKFLFGGVCLCCAAGVNASIISVNPSNPYVTLDTLNPTTQFTATVQADFSDVTDKTVVGGSFVLSWDPNLLTLVDTSSSSSNYVTSHGPNFIPTDAINATAGTLTYTFAMCVFSPVPCGTNPMSNIFNVYDLTFSVASNTTALNTWLDLSSSGESWFGNNGSIASELTDPHYNSRASATNAIVEFGSPAPVPVPPAVLLFGSGLVGLTCIARRKRTNTANQEEVA